MQSFRNRPYQIKAIIVYPKSDVIIVAENITKYYGGPESFIVKYIILKIKNLLQIKQ